MLVKELMHRLSLLNPEYAVMILDGFNGGGHPREINIEPRLHLITSEDQEMTSDCEDMPQGASVYCLGYGSY